ncbi:glycoside hydrolase family 97 protein [Dysgonomonas sp. 216]|uniref:glycoside hydrolase family 97 protein n=1 Tax=Dysgonomonas sp. 216 TaxID=2302934 RepID=UPI0021085D33|nr:glycoside hydrolase family 97 protein [Dysgonomonas sp. 216]
MNLRRINYLFCFFFICIGFPLSAGSNTVSPNKKLNIKLHDNAKNPYFSVDHNGKTIFSNIKLGLETDLQNFSDNLKLVSVSKSKWHKDDYIMITGKRSHCTNFANERIYRFENDKQQILEVILRVYNDGVAFQYNIDATSDNENIINESTTYLVEDKAKRWMQKYAIGYEGFYPLSEEHTSGKWGYPALMEFPNSTFVLFTEANMSRDRCGSYLDNTKKGNEYQVQLEDEKLSVKGKWSSPWRVLIIGSLSTIVESTLVTDLSDPSKVSDTNWIKPGPVSWIYWAYNHSSSDFQIVKEYIDLAAEMRWPYDLIDWQWDAMGNGGNVEDAVKYALEKGVKPMLWYNSSTHWCPAEFGPLYRLNKKEDREKEYAWLNKLGVVGIKIDFFPGDKASSMNYYIDLLEDAAKYKLMINFHGSTIPRGWQRTYPHMMTMEAVYGAEWYNNNKKLTTLAACHNTTLPFTRNVIGPMDYTPGTFSDSQNPHITSYGHELALPVIFESALQHMPDKPSTYYSLPSAVKNFLSELPTAWDDTKLLKGYPGEHIIIARKKGDKWYLGGINGTDKEKMLSVDLKKLSLLGKTITIISDGANDKVFNIEENIKITKKNQKMDINCLPRGGFVAVVK